MFNINNRVYNRYLLIQRWAEESPPESIRSLAAGTQVKLLTGESYTVDHVGIGRVLLHGIGWVDWREIILPSAKG